MGALGITWAYSVRGLKVRWLETLLGVAIIALLTTKVASRWLV
jgi:hypothetical protein